MPSLEGAIDREQSTDDAPMRTCSRKGQPEEIGQGGGVSTLPPLTITPGYENYTDHQFTVIAGGSNVPIVQWNRATPPFKSTSEFFDDVLFIYLCTITTPFRYLLLQ